MKINNNKIVFFNLRSSSRERMWDTAREAARVCEPIIPNQNQKTSIDRNAGYKGNRHLIIRKLKRFILNTFPLINFQLVKGSNRADLLYMWGAFPKKTKKPFVVELDNPFVLSYYNTEVFHQRKRKIKKMLRKANFITFLSDTARNHTLELLGNEFKDKSKVLPPFMNSNYKDRVDYNDGNVRFLFVGLGFRRKGGPELLEAFSRLKHENARLTVIANVDDNMKEKYIADSRITFLPPQPRKTLFDKYYKNHDVFLFPSLHESLGVVVLEALSFGMGVISTNVYATPEMVKNDINGKLLPHPALEPVVFNGVSTIDCATMSRQEFSEKYMTSDLYKKLVSDLVLAMDQAMTQSDSWKKESVKLFERKYSPTIWEQNFRSVIYD